MSLPVDFDAASFLYLNPELGAYSNVLSIELARDFFLNNYSTTSNMAYNLSVIPQSFDGRIFLADNKDGLDISTLNKTIKLAMSNEGYSELDLDTLSQYLPTVYKDLRLLASNVFTFKDLDYGITSRNLLEGDEIKIGINNVSFVFSKVMNIDSNTNSFTVSNYFASTFSNPDLDYLLVGHKIYDSRRLSHTNFVRNNRSSNPIFGDFSNRFYGMDPEFNVAVYRLLYPDARLLTDEQCLLDYTSRRNNNDIRIGKASEIVKSIDYIYTELRNLRVSCNLRVDKNFILNDYWVKGITSNSTRNFESACNDLLITEKGSKGYLDMYRTTVMDLNDLIVGSNATFCNQVNMIGSNVYIAGSVTLCNELFQVGNAFLSSNLSVNNNISLSNDLFVGRNTIVSCNLDVQSNVSIIGDLSIQRNSYFVGDVEMGSMLKCSNIVSFGSNLGLSNDIHVKGNGEIDGNLTVRSDFMLEGNISLNNSLFVASNISLSNNLTVNSNVFVGSNLSISNLITAEHGRFLSNLVVDKELQTETGIVYGTFTARSNVVVLGTVGFNDDATFESNIFLNGTMRIGSSNTLDTLLLDVLGGVRADDYLVTSDVRVKKNITPFDTEYCSHFVQNTPLVKYNLTYDEKQKSRYGFLAHELEKLDSNVITHVSDFIPNLMMKGTIIALDGTVQLEEKIKCQLQYPCLVKCFIDGKQSIVTLIGTAKKKRCLIDGIQHKDLGKKIVLYGTKIDDFKAVDYMQMFAICMGAIKNTMERVSILESKLCL
jgi:predicted acyltransferase (DUF342 family)